MLGAGAPAQGENPGWLASLLGLDAVTRAARYRESLAHRRSVFKIAVDQVHQETCVALRNSPWYRNQLLEKSIGRDQIELLVIEKAWEILPKDLRPKESIYSRRMGLVPTVA